MGLVARIIDSFTGDGGELSAKVEMYQNDNATARILNPPGVDARPLDDDFCFTEDSEDTEGGKDILGFIDPENEPVSEKGEFRVYSRIASGEIQAEIYIKKTGLTELENKVFKLSDLIGELFTEIKDITTTGSPTVHTVSAASKVKLTLLENKFKLLIG